MDGTHQNGKEGAEKNEKNRWPVGNTEPYDGKRNPRDRRNRAQELNGRLDRPFDPAPPANRDTDGNASDRRYRVAAEHAPPARERRNPPVSGILLRRFRDR